MTAPPEGSDHELVRGLLLVSTAFALVPAGLAVADRWIPRMPVFFARWGFGHLARVAVVAVLAVAVAVVLLQELGVEDSILAGLALTVVALGLGAAVAARVAHRLQPEGALALGFRREGAGRAILAAGLVYLLALPALMGLQVLWPPLFEALGGSYEKQRVLLDLQSLRGPGLVAGFALAALAAPLVEEVLFRGFLQPLLVQNFREVGGVVLTSILFALLHGVAYFLPLFAFSLVLGWARQRSAGLWASIAVHGLHNGITLALTLALGPTGDTHP